MLEKFNFYDLLGYLIPGGTMVLALYWVGVSAFGLILPGLPSDLGSSLLFLGLSYLAGHLVQAVGNMWEESLRRSEGGRFSDRLLLPDDAPNRLDPPLRFTPELRTRIFHCAGAAFSGPAAPGDLVSPPGLAWRREVFEQCYALVVQEDCAQHTEIFLALNGLSRGLFVASGIGLVASAVVALKQVLVWNLSGVLPSTVHWTADGQQFALGCFAFIGFFLTMLGMRRIFEAFRWYFARSVYYSFLAWFGKQEFKAQLPTGGAQPVPVPLPGPVRPPSSGPSLGM